MTMRGKMVHKFSDRADEQRKEAEVVRLRTPPRNIWIDLMTGQFCDPEPIEHGGQVIPFTAPRNGSRGKDIKALALTLQSSRRSTYPRERLSPVA
jgi:hypothetical protein